MCSKSKLPSGVFIMDNENNIWKFIYSSVHALLLHGDEKHTHYRDHYHNYIIHNSYM